MTENLLQDGISLMLYGMGTVFVFLTVLVFATTAMSYLTNRFFPEAEPQAAPPPAANSSSQGIDPAVVSAISIAVTKFRENRAKRK